MEEEWMRDRAQLRDLLNSRPSDSSAGISSGDRTLGRVGSKNGASACEKVIRRIKNSYALVRERTMRPTSAGTGASRPESWRCVCLHQSTWDAPLVHEPCSIICREIQSCKLQEFAYRDPAALSGSCFGKPVVFCPSHRGTSGPLTLGRRWRRFKWISKM
jgi:hypothetical protein